MLEPGWKNRMGYYRMVVRCTEWIERQKVSLLDVRGIGKGSLSSTFAHFEVRFEPSVNKKEPASRCVG